jgi:hypothetical protein
MSTGFDLAQTFYVDPDAVQGADYVYITGVDLYVAAKPTEGKTKSGIYSPGMSISICGTFEDGSPNFNNVNSYNARLEYASIVTDTTGTTPTTFTFRHPVRVNTKSTKAFLIKFDGSDPDFKIWYNKAGDNVFGSTTKTQVNSGKVDGYLFKITNGKSITPDHDADLAFKIRIAKFSSASTTFKIKNRPYDLLKVSSITGAFKGGEDVYQKRTALAGTISISDNSLTVTGSGTSFSFSAGDKVVLTDGTLGNTDIRTVLSVANTTSLVLDNSPSFSNAAATYYKTVVGTMFYADPVADHIFIQDSTANSTVYLTTSTLICGVDSQAQANISSIVDFTVNGVVPNYAVKTPPGTTSTATFNFVNSSNSMISTNAIDAPLGQRALINQYAGKLASRTNEVGYAANASFDGTLTFNTTNLYTSPEVYENDLDLFVERFDINNLSTGEAAGQGQSLARYISKPVTLSSDQRAEDLKLYVRAFKPYGASILAYAKFRNSEDPETTDVKNWTQLVLNSNGAEYSNPSNITDVLDFEYDVPLYGSGTTAPGQFTSTLSSAVITGTSGTVNTNIVPGSLVRVYSSIFTNTYFVDTVLSSNTTTFTVSSAISNSSLVSTGLYVDVITNAKDAFIDNQHQNVLTYFNNSYAKFQTYDSFVIKLVMLSSDGTNVPFIDDVRAIAVSA